MSKSSTFFLLSLSFIVGVAVGSFYQLEIILKGVILLLALIIIFAWWRSPQVRIIGFCIIFIMLGSVRYEISEPKDSTDLLKYFNDTGTIIFEGLVVEEPDIRADQSKITIQSINVIISGEQKYVTGKILVTIPKYPEYNYGDKLKITGEILTPREYDSFSYKEYLSKMGIYSVSYDPGVELISKSKGNIAYQSILAIKKKFKEQINIIFPEPQASLQSGLLLGAKRGMSDELKDKFNITGVSHIIVISGFHVSIVAGLLMNLGLALTLSRKQALFISVLGILFFIVITGLQTSAVRAGIMGGLVLLAMYSGRLSDVKNALLLAGTVMLLVNPKLLMFDVGFQLSFLATIGIIYLSPSVAKYLKIIPETFKFRESATMTLSAQVATLPIIIYNFERFSLIAPITNILTVPMVPVAMMLGFVATTVSLIWESLGRFLALGAWAVLSYIIFVVRSLSELRFSAFEINKFWTGWIVIYYLAMIVIIWQMGRSKMVRNKNK